MHKTPVIPSSVALAERIFLMLVGLFIACLVLTNLIAGKYIVLWGIPFSASILVYPYTFVITDIVSEIYGLERANRLVIIGFIVTVVMTAWISLINALPTDPQSPVDAGAFGAIFGLVPGLVLGSMVGYLAGQWLDVQLFEWLRRKTNHRHLWLRNNVATLTSQLVDTLIVMTISWIIWPRISTSGIQPISWSVWRELVGGQYLGKVIFAFLDTPVVYVSIYLIKRKLGLQ